ncbi:MAG: Ppx/GppA family phosphatase [Alphaproteobacteria bacterium]|nr:Ppx/GppA family phosphatase [Alphaproteobacteria bacterium]
MEPAAQANSLRQPPHAGKLRAQTYAALDLGTNNCRLLVARPEGQSFNVVDAFSRIVRLGEGIGESGTLGEAAMDRTIAALKICASKIHRRGVTRYRAVATEACRRAANCDAFLARTAHETGLEIEIISTGEEAMLALDSCTPLLSRSAVRALLFDIGGGSTELIWVKLKDRAKPEVVGWTSVAYGVVTLAERFGGDLIGSDRYREMTNLIMTELAPFADQHRLKDAVQGSEVQLLGTSGTVTTIAGVHLKLPRYDRSKVDGIALDFGSVRAVVDDLVAKDFAARSAYPCIGPGRGDVVIAGCAILEAIMRACPVGGITVADRGLREGLLLGMMRADNVLV